jgi:hypothetical protein
LSGLSAQLRAKGRGRPLPGRGPHPPGGAVSVAAAEEAVEADLTALSAAERRRQELLQLERQVGRAGGGGRDCSQGLAGLTVQNFSFR